MIYIRCNAHTIIKDSAIRNINKFRLLEDIIAIIQLPSIIESNGSHLEVKRAIWQKSE